MKAQKQFCIPGMFKALKIPGICLILVALFAPTAHAATSSMVSHARFTHARDLPNHGTRGSRFENIAGFQRSGEYHHV